MTLIHGPLAATLRFSRCARSRRGRSRKRHRQRHPGLTEGNGHAYQYTEAFSFGLTLVLLGLWVILKEGRPFSSLGFRGRGAVGKLLLGLVIGAAMMSAGVLLGKLLGQYDTGVSRHTNVGSAALLGLIPLALVFVVQASTEEAATRGYMLPVGARQLPAWVAIVASSVLFAVIHLNFSPLPLLNITLYAIFACLVALEQGSLWLICGLHAGWNFFQGNVFGLPVSGNPEATSLFSFGPATGASDALSGGDFGLEASAIGSVILAVAIAVAFVRLRRRAAAAQSSPESLATPV